MTQPSGVDRFVERYAPDADARVPEPVFLDYAHEHAPAELIHLWGAYGIGFYGAQRLAIVDPGRWLPALEAWLGAGVESLPFAVTSFGHVYHVGPDGAVQCLDPHFQSNEVVAADLDSFFGDHLLGDASHLADLEGPRGGGRHKFGELHPGECYYFEPPIALGGQVRPDHLAKGDGAAYVEQVHRDILAEQG